MTKKIKVISWDEAKKMLPESHPNKAFCELVSQVCESLKSDNKDYVYHIELEFGDKIIEKGSRFDFKANGFSIKPNVKYSPNNIQDFNDDLIYTNDPLGMVLSNYIEVYLENIHHISKYRVPLNIIKEGELFGLFGTLDIFTKIGQTKVNQRDWFAGAGNISSLLVASPLHISKENEALDDSIKPFFCKEIVPEKWEKFINFYRDEKWLVDIVYFPHHIIDLIQNKSSDILYFEGWKQSYHLRNVILFDPSITNSIRLIGTELLHHDRIFLNTIYNYIYNVVYNNAPAYIPLDEKEHFFFKAFEKFKSQSVFNMDSVLVYPFKFDVIEEGKFGILPIFMLPIIYNYKIESLNKLLNDLKKINKKVDDKFKIFDFIEGYGPTGGGASKQIGKKDKDEFLIKEPKEFKEKYKPHLEGIKIMNTTSKEFSNIIVIKR